MGMVIKRNQLEEYRQSFYAPSKPDEDADVELRESSAPGLVQQPSN